MALRETLPWWAYAILLSPAQISRNLQRAERAGRLERAPNLWQLSLGVLRMWHRVALRGDTVGTCEQFATRATWRARLLAHKPFRLPCLLLERAIAPLDLTGLASPPERLMRHLMGAHHDGVQFIYDLELLSCYPGQLEQLQERVQTLLGANNARSRWLRDLVVYEHYHENLERAVTHALEHGLQVPAVAAADPDISFVAYMRWCAAQPATPAATWSALRRGQYSLERGIQL